MRHRIAELEFYYNTAVFPDPYPHGDELQRTAGQWCGARQFHPSPLIATCGNRSVHFCRYFHRTGGTYRSGTFKGLDITIGTDEKNYGGILIRSTTRNL